MLPMIKINYYRTLGISTQFPIWAHVHIQHNFTTQFRHPIIFNLHCNIHSNISISEESFKFLVLSPWGYKKKQFLCCIRLHLNAFSFINLVQHVSINIAAIFGAHFYIWLCPHHTLSTYVIVITTCNVVHTRVLYLKCIALVHHNLIEVL